MSEGTRVRFTKDTGKNWRPLWKHRWSWRSCAPLCCSFTRPVCPSRIIFAAFVHLHCVFCPMTILPNSGNAMRIPRDSNALVLSPNDGSNLIVLVGSPTIAIFPPTYARIEVAEPLLLESLQSGLGVCRVRFMQGSAGLSEADA